MTQYHEAGDGTAGDTPGSFERTANGAGKTAGQKRSARKEKWSRADAKNVQKFVGIDSGKAREPVIIECLWKAVRLRMDRKKVAGWAGSSEGKLWKAIRAALGA